MNEINQLKTKVLFLSLFSCGLALAILWHLSMILLHGEFYITEDNWPVLYAEFVLVSAILLYGFKCWKDTKLPKKPWLRNEKS